MAVLVWNCDSCGRSGPVELSPEDSKLSLLEFGAKYGFEKPEELALRSHKKQFPDCDNLNIGYTLT